MRRRLLAHATVFLLVASFVTYYGQLDRKQSADTYPAVYTALALIQHGRVNVDPYLPIFQRRAGEHPTQVVAGTDGRLYSLFPAAPALLAVPVVAAWRALGVPPSNFNGTMEAGFLAGAAVTAVAVAVLFVLLTRLTSRARAFVVAATFAWATPTWAIAGQGLWQHGPAMLCLAGALLAVKDRRFMLCGFALASMVVFRPSTAVIAAFLIPLYARRLHLVAVGALAPAIALATYNRAAFGCVTCSGYAHDFGDGGGFSGNFWHGLSGNLVSPGRGIFVYSPVLLFSLAGVWLGRRDPFFRWCSVALLAQVLLVSSWFEWWGGEAFGPRQLVDALPLFALLLVPALEHLDRHRYVRVTYAVLFAYSATVEFLAAALWPGTRWYDTHAVRVFSTWWHPLDTELTAFFSDPRRLLVRGGLMALVVAAAAIAGAAAAMARLPRLERRPLRDGHAPVALCAAVACLLVAVAPFLVRQDEAGGQPTGGFALALAVGTLVLLWARPRSPAPLLLVASVAPVALLAGTGWALALALAALTLTLAREVALSLPGS